MTKPAIIVVSSEVVRGSVGGRASVFALERMGFPVWFVPTVTLSWHPGHGPAIRLVPEAERFAGLVDDAIGSRWLCEVGAVLSGYLGAADQAAPVARLVEAAKALNPEVKYLCDPNIGDDGGLFVSTHVARAVRDRLIPLADMAMPNRHELAWLTGAEAGDNEGLAKAARALGVEEVIVTSAFAGDGQTGNLAVTGDGADLVAHRRLDAVPHGTGDLFAAVYLAARLGGHGVGEASARAGAIVLAVASLANKMDADELPLVAGQSLFEP